MSKATKAILIVIAILLVDQVVKIIIKTNMYLGQSIDIFGDWFKIRYIENPGMAFGLDIPGRFGKVSLSLFRLIAIIGIIWYMRTLIQKNAKMLLLVCVSMILAGAVGNLLDSIFYGFIFDKGTVYDPEIGRWIGYSGLAHTNFAGYAAPFKGCVVDWIYFPLIQGTYPGWIPFLGGRDFEFFRPIFNIADSSISIGVVIILIFQKRLFKDL
jgi:signal peptidase II